jgi:GH43 family beta-xylosidase
MSRALLWAVLLVSTVSSAQTFTNPILGETAADPSIVQYNGYYYHAFSDGSQRIFVRKSATLTGIGSAPAVQVWLAPATGAYSRETWAPELQLIQGRWYIYFAASDGNNANHRMFALESTSLDPQGAYVFKGQLRPTTDTWAIDGAVIQKDDGSLYFVWSGWPGNVDGQQNLYIAAMSNPWTLSGERVLIAMPTFDWEGRGMPLNEAPQPLRLGSRYGIVFSASGSWTQEYTLGLLTNTDGNLLNPKSWVKTGPVFRKNADVYGVGHPTFVKSPDGTESWIAYHAKRLSTDGWADRSVRAQEFYIASDGSLNLGVARSVSVAQPRPGGENGAPASPNPIDGHGWGSSFEGAARSGSWTVSSATAASGTTLGAGWAQLFRGNANFETVAVSADVQWVATGTTSASPKFGIYGTYEDGNNFVAAFLDKKYAVFASYAVVGGVVKGWQNTALPAGFNWSVAHNLRVERSWSGDYKFFLDGVLQQTRQLGNVLGQMGLVTEDTQAHYSNVKMDPTQGWGDPAVDGYQNGKYEIRSARDVMSWGTGAGWKGLWRQAPRTTAGYTLESGIRLLSQGSTAYPKYGLYGCYQDARNHMTVWLDPKYGVLTTHAVSGGVDLGWQNVALGTFSFTTHHTLKVVRRGSTFTTYVDGVQKQVRSVGLTTCQTGLVAEDTQVEYTHYRVF